MIFRWLLRRIRMRQLLSRKNESATTTSLTDGSRLTAVSPLVNVVTLFSLMGRCFFLVSRPHPHFLRLDNTHTHTLFLTQGVVCLRRPLFTGKAVKCAPPSVHTTEHTPDICLPRHVQYTCSAPSASSSAMLEFVLACKPLAERNGKEKLSYRSY